MKKNFLRGVPAAAAALGLVLALNGPARAVTAEAFERLGMEPANGIFEAPDFKIPTLEGGPMSLAEHRGHVVLLNFWTTW